MDYEDSTKEQRNKNLARWQIMSKAPVHKSLTQNPCTNKTFPLRDHTSMPSLPKFVDNLGHPPHIVPNLTIIK